MIAFVAGNPSVDRLYEVDRVHPGLIHRPELVRVVPGGKGLNAARAARLLGADAHVLAILAGHAGRWICEALAAERVAGTFVWSSGETRTCISVASAREGGDSITGFYERSEPIPTKSWQQLEAAAAELVPRAELVCLSGSLARGAPVDGYRRIAEIARAAQVPIAIDSHGPELLAALDARPQLIKINGDEAAEALASVAPDFAPAPVAGASGEAMLRWSAAAAAELQRRIAGNQITVVTCGTSGMALATHEDEVVAGRLDQIGRYPVGSGDATLAGMAVGLCRSMGARELLALALAAGAANAELPGPGVLDPIRVRALAARAAIAPVTVG